MKKEGVLIKNTKKNEHKKKKFKVQACGGP